MKPNSRSTVSAPTVSRLMPTQLIAVAAALLLLAGPQAVSRRTMAADVFLTIGGGYARSGNQASLEKNVLYFQRVLREQDLDQLPHSIYFADGRSSERDLQVIDQTAVPKANRLMAELFGDTDELGLSYRNHEIDPVRGSTRPENIRKWFKEQGKQLAGGDRLIVYVTAHGNRSSDRRDPFDTTIATWNNTSIKMKEFVRLLDGLDEGVKVVVIMVQCHAGGFARLIFNDGDPDEGLSKQQRIGFYATVHDRPAAGCTPEVDEASYVEYSTFFWAAISGRDRQGRPIDPPDYDGDGAVSFDEAHAYVILTADTIDLPVKTSGEYLSVHSKFGDDDDSKLLANDEPYDEVLALANPVQKAVLEGLSQQLDLAGNDRLVEAWKVTQPNRSEGRSRFRGRRSASPEDRLRSRIRSDLKNRWPELANVLNPVAIELVTSDSDEFVEAIENHPEYERYLKLKRESDSRPDEKKRKVKFDRFLRAADNVILWENLQRLGDQSKIRAFESIVEGERDQLK